MKLNWLRSAISFLSVFFLAVTCTASAATSTPEILPPIDARRFDIKTIEKSSSGKIYLFESLQVIPKTGNLILIYDHEKPAMAFRVLKNDQNKKQFVGKRVRRYDQTSELTLNQSYSSLEKLADLLPPPPSSETSESLDKSLDTTPPSPAPTPSSAPIETPTPSPTPTQEVVPAEKQDSDLDAAALDKIDESNPSEDEGAEDESLEVSESSRLDPFNNILSVGAGYFSNSSNFSGSGVMNNGFSFSFAHVLFHDLFINKKSIQDSLGFEIGGIYYRIVNKDGVNDIYNMLPFYGDLLYQLHLSPTFAFGLYGGLQYNYMTSASNPGQSLSTLQGLQMNVGLGIFYGIGPQWLLRADLGWDRITGGLSIKW